MNKSELGSQVASQFSLTRATADNLVSAVFSAISETLAREENVTIAGFGTFSTKGFSLCFRSHQMLIVLLRSRHGFRTVPGDVRELSDLEKLVSIAVRQAGGPVFGSN